MGELGRTEAYGQVITAMAKADDIRWALWTYKLNAERDNAWQYTA